MAQYLFANIDMEVMTYKAGKWIFTAKCAEAEIVPLLLKANALYDGLSGIPILPHFRTRLEKEIITSSIHGTAAIEGNTLSPEEVEQVINAKGPQKDTQRANREITNLGKLYQCLDDVQISENGSFSETMLKKFHATLMDGLETDGNHPGMYRNSPVVVGDNAHGGIYTPPKILADIKLLIGRFADWINSEDIMGIDPLLRCACAHYYLARIHPFWDGNGRTARFCEAYMLSCVGKRNIAPMLSNYYYMNKDDYFCVFSETEKRGDMTAFFRFFLQGLIFSLQELKKKMYDLLDVVLMSDFIRHLFEQKELTARQKDLLDIMLRFGIAISTDTLFSDSATRGIYLKVSMATARRDIRKLLEMNLIVPVGKFYKLNTGILH